MNRIRIQRPKLRRARRGPAVLPLDPRDPAILHAKHATGPPLPIRR
jgi:hypothetical protein